MESTPKVEKKRSTSNRMEKIEKSREDHKLRKILKAKKTKSSEKHSGKFFFNIL